MCIQHHQVLKVIDAILITLLFQFMLFFIIIFFNYYPIIWPILYYEFIVLQLINNFIKIKRMLQQQIKQLQKNIDRQLQTSPLSKKMKKSQIYQEKPSKINFIMQTSSTPPQVPIKSSKLPLSLLKTSQKVEILQKESPIKQSKVQGSLSAQQKKANQHQFLSTQNISLKQQTLQLIQQLQSLLQNNKPKKYGIQHIASDDQPQQIKIKKVVIHKQQLKIFQLENQIKLAKKHIDLVFDQDYVVKEQADVKLLQKQLKILEKQKFTLIQTIKTQDKGIKQTEIPVQFKEKFERTKSQVQKLKQQIKSLLLKTQQNQKLLRKKHQKAVTQHSKIKKLQKMIKQNNQKAKKGLQNQKLVTIQMISQIQQQIAQLQQQREINQKTWTSKLTNIQSQLQSRQLQQSRKMLILKQKQKQARLNDLKIKELKKLAQNQYQVTRKVSISGDQINKEEKTPGRKRNIIHMESNRDMGGDAIGQVATSRH